MARKIEKIIAFCALAGIILIAALNLYVYRTGSAYIAEEIKDLPHVQAAIVLGAAVTRAGTPSPVLQDRVAMAIDLYKQGFVSKILVSGSNSTTTYNEVDPVRKVMIESGIPSEDIFLDHAGFDTYSTMYRAREVFKVSSAIVVSQDFHLPRALYIARSLGLDAHGIPADRGTYTLNNYVRELFARPKAFLDVMMMRMPKFVGEPIPITGDGTAT